MQPRKVVRPMSTRLVPSTARWKLTPGRRTQGAWKEASHGAVRPRLLHQAERERGREQKIDGQADEGDPPGQFCGYVLGEPRDDTPADRNEKYGRQYHRNTAMAIKTAPPRAMAITYQRTFPDWVATTTSDASPVIHARARKK